VLARPRLTLAAWGAAIAVLASFGVGIQDELREGDYVLPGTESARAADLDERGFGQNELTPVLLTGPREQLERQGPPFVRDLRRHWTVLSPWDPGARSSQLRPSPRAALALVSLSFDLDDRWTIRLAPLTRVIRAHVHDPVRAHVSGNTVGAGATNQAAVDAATKAQKIAIPVLLLVLLLVFRSPLAAAIPAAVGIATVAASAGIISLVARVHDLAGPAVSFAAMMGLALGVDYSLLIVSRYREELYADDAVSPRDAAATAAATAGRTVLFAGLVLIAAMGLAVALSPGNVLVSVAAGVVIAVVLSLVSAAVAVPAALAVIGRRIDRWRIGSRPLQSPLLTRAARAAMARPVVVVVAALVGLLALAAPALSIESAPPNFTQLPTSDPARADYEAIKGALSPGVVTPFEIVVRAREGSVLESRRLRAVQRLERTLARDPGVVAVSGPGALAHAGPGAAKPGGDRIAMFVNTSRGSDTIRVFVMPRYFAAATGNMRLRDRLVDRARAFEARTGLEAAVGGLAGQYVDYEREASAYIPLLVLCLSGMTFVLLVVILRAIVLPAVAIALNLTIVAAAFGALRLLFQGTHPLLGGPGFVDVISIAAIFTILFALSVDYEVFLLTRMHEAIATGRDPDAAVLHGIGRTASVVTGAAMIMTAVFLCFATSGFITPRQFGVGLAIAVTLDALVLRILLLPAAMRLLGARSWWLPAWLERRIPRLDVEGTAATADGRLHPPTG
jgi:RND superfamily putative drug exporter